MNDWGDIIYDMRVDWAGPLPPNPRIPEAKEFIERTEKFFVELEKERLEKKQKHAKDELWTFKPEWNKVAEFLIIFCKGSHTFPLQRGILYLNLLLKMS